MMMIHTTEKKSVISLLLVGSLFMLTGCLQEKKNDSIQEIDASQSVSNNGEVLLSIDGKPVLYADDFEDQKAMAQQSNQQLNMVLQMMPDAEYSMLFKSIKAGHLMKEWVIRQGIDQKEELVKQRRQYHDAIDLQLYMKYYEDAHPIKVSESEAEAFYKAKRDMIPGLIASPAGVEVAYVKFDTKAQAEGFATKVKDGSEKNMRAAAKEADATVVNLVVNQDSSVCESVKNVALSATKFPAKEVVKTDDGSYWVLGLLKKKDVEYRSFETPEIKAGITKMCTDEKREIELAKQIEKLTKEFNVVENKAYFDNKQQKNARALQKAEQIVMQAQQGDLDLDEEDDVLFDDKN